MGAMGYPENATGPGSGFRGFPRARVFAVAATLFSFGVVSGSDAHAPAPTHGETPKSKASTPAPPHRSEPASLPAGEGGDGEEEKGHGSAVPASLNPASAPASNPPALRVLIKGALERLKDGNLRFATGKTTSPRRGSEQRSMIAKAQLPFAIVVGCADSRVPPEILFDQGLGDLFVVRVAGNVLDDPSLGSIEYAVEHLGSRLIVVLGHERCGAVDAACKGGNPGGHIGSLVQAIKPAVEAARKHKGNLLEEAVEANVRRVVDQLKGSWPVLAPEVHEDKLSVVGGIYDLETGKVAFLP